MATQALSRLSERMPTVFEDFFKPWNEWFDNGGLFGRTMNIPAVNITEQKNDYLVSLAVPGMKKEDFKIDIDGNMLTISSAKEETNEEKEKRFTRMEYNYSSFSRSFTLPETINGEAINAEYTDGILRVTLPKKEEAKNKGPKEISIS